MPDTPATSFYTDTIMKSPAFSSANPYRGVDLLEPVTRAAVANIIKAAADAGTTLQVLETFRSEARQQALFAQGATQLRQVGVHHYGLACDLGIVVGGQINWKADYSVLGRLAKQFGLVWGGDWGHPANPGSFRDYDHVQRIAVADQSRLFNGSWYPPQDYVAPAVG